MTLIKFKPVHTRELLRDSMIPNHMMHMFDSFFNEAAGKPERNGSFRPRTDIVENAQSYDLHISLPGLKKEDIKIDVNGDLLTISGERKLHNDNKEDKYHMVESFYGKFSRSFTLLENVDKQNIQAELLDGVLNLSIPKVEVKENKTTVSIK